MTNPPELTDRKALDRNRARATVDFLHREAIGEIKERLAEVNRTFTAPAVVTGFPAFWREAVPDAAILPDDEILALTHQSQDIIIHGLSLHWANDPVGQLVQCRSALRPDGLFLGVLFGGQTLTELRASLGEAEVRVAGGISPRILPMPEIRELGGLLQRAGFALPVADSLTIPVRYTSPWHLMHDLRAMGEANALANRARRPTGASVMFEAARIYFDNFSETDGMVRATFELIFLTGWAPDDNQQKPQRPGSAILRLSEALGVPENKLSDTSND